MRKKEDFYLQLITPNHPITMIPDKKDLVPAIAGFPDILMERCAASALQSLLKEISAFDQIVPVSGFRTQKEQQDIWDMALKEHGLLYTKQYVAIPGCSEHQSGLAIDLAWKKEDIDFICPDFPEDGICGEFRKLAPKYGFILRYPKDKEAITHISYEPWHFRYVGIPHAQNITRQHMVLEEYIALHSYSKVCIVL